MDADREGRHLMRGLRPVHPPGARRGEPLPAGERRRVTLVLRPSGVHPAHPVAARHRDRHHLPPGAVGAASKQELELLNALHPGDLARVRDFARAHLLDVLHVSHARHDVVLEGSVTAINRAFGVQLHAYRHGEGSYHGHRGEVSIPRELAPLVVGVLGLDGVPFH